MSHSSPSSPDLPEHQDAHEHTPQRDEVAESEEEARSLHQMKRSWAVLAAVLALGFVMINSSTGGASGLLQRLTGRGDTTETIKNERPPAISGNNGPLTLSDFSNHPDLVFQPYLTGQVMGGHKGNQSSSLISQFRQFLQIYEWRQNKDDNFTIRVIDDRTDKVLEVYELEDEREAYKETGKADLSPGGAIDKKRRAATDQLVDKYVEKGIPQDPIMVKWGRGTQVRNAQKLNQPYIEYAVRLTKYLGLSLLPTQIGLVETFNHDRWKSSVGARSRYQMMPSFLVKLKINRYKLRTESGRTIRVREEWNPLMTMEPAFKIVAGYVGAVGHEIPGISAYHTGPANIYKLYRYYLRRNPQQINKNTTVMDAYMWAVTEGYSYMSAHSSFGPFSRGYVASAYGGLKALDDVPIDTAKTMLATRVRLKAGATISLRKLLSTLQGGSYPATPDQITSAKTENTATTPPATQKREASPPQSLYNQFRRLNPQIVLPPAPDSAGVPDAGNVILQRTAQGDQVHFFLPLGGASELQKTDLGVLDPSETFRFDHSTYANPKGQDADAYQDYQKLQDRVFHYGFTESNKQDLDQLTDKFEQLAKQQPTPWRKDMLDVIKSHRQIWNYGAWDALHQATRQAFGTLPPEARASAAPTGEQASTESAIASAL